MSQNTTEFSCYVVVKGTASDPDDEGLEGAYEVTVRTSVPVTLDTLSESEQHAITAAVLDEFHDHQGIAVLDDFSIAVYLEIGIEIVEIAEQPDSDDQFVAVHYQGPVDQDQLRKHCGTARNPKPTPITPGNRRPIRMTPATTGRCRASSKR